MGSRLLGWVLAARRRSLYNRSISKLTLDYWEDHGGYVGRLREIPSVISQGDTPAELRETIVDAYKLMISDAPKLRRHVKSTQVLVSA